MEQLAMTFPDRDKGFYCSHCGSYVKLYKRSFNSNMAVCLLALLKHNAIGFVKIEDFLLSHGYKRCGDFSYLVHYRMLEKQKGKRDDGSPKNGFYRITGLGILFAEGKVKVQSKFLIENNKLIGFEGKEVSINDVKKEKFHFDNLMYND